MDAIRPESVDAERGRERRVDPAGEADHDVAEAVLLDVVVEPEGERQPHLLELRRERGDGAADLVSVLHQHRDLRGAALHQRPREIST
jgi:hypothetical protein